MWGRTDRHAERRTDRDTDRQTDMKKVIVASRKFIKALKKPLKKCNNHFDLNISGLKKTAILWSLYFDSHLCNRLKQHNKME
jgi:hypothetical protein